MTSDTRQALAALPPLPKKRRWMLCTKCGFSGPTEAEASPRGAKCQRCDYTAFVEEQDYNDDEMQAYARAALSAQPVAGAVDRITVQMTYEQVQAVYLLLSRSRLGGKESPEKRPAWGWQEKPLVDVENALEPLHRAIHDRRFNAMNRSFFGNDSRSLPESPLATTVDAAPQPQAAPAPEPSAQGEPVAWLRQDWSGSGPSSLSFDGPPDPKPVRDEVVNPVWTPLYASAPSTPPPAVVEAVPLTVARTLIAALRDGNFNATSIEPGELNAAADWVLGIAPKAAQEKTDE